MIFGERGLFRVTEIDTSVIFDNRAMTNDILHRVYHFMERKNLSDPELCWEVRPLHIIPSLNKTWR